MSFVARRGHSGPRIAESGDATNESEAWDAPRVAVGECIAGRYTVIDVVGQGGCGTIYEAEHLGLGRRVAIKIPHVGVEEHTQLRQRFLREVRVSAMVRHENVLEIHDADALPDATPFLVMELLRGESLASRIARGPVDSAEAVQIVLQLLDAVAALSAHEIVHRDIKPANVMLCPQEGGAPCLVKLVDFGLAKSLSDHTGQLTQVGTILGTPDYMAPEQIVAAKVDERADIYACGVVLYELLTGKNPHGGLDFSAHLARALGTQSFVKRFKRIGCPEAVERVVMKALARDPEDRYASAAAMRAALSLAAQGRPRGPRLRQTLVAARLPVSLSLCVLMLAASQHVGPFAEEQSIVDARDPVVVSSADARSRSSRAQGRLADGAQPADARRPLAHQTETIDEGLVNARYADALQALAVGEYAQAELALRATLQRDRSHAGALRTRVVLALARHDVRAANEALDRYLERYPRATDAHELRSRVANTAEPSASLL